MDFKNHKAIYMQIADHIVDNILQQNLRTGQRLDSVRDMAANVQVNPNTVMRTYAWLQEEGIIYNKRGIGYFVAEDAFEKTRQLRRTEFIKTVLPHLFKQMELLQLSFSDLEQLKLTQGKKAG